MSFSEAGRRDFLVSFNSADRDWAEWIAAELEAGGYTTFFQHWDFRPGSNFVLEMHKAAALGDRTIAVLSADYVTALFTQPEWAAALVHDPTGDYRKLIPIRVKPCVLEGLLKPIVYADLVGLTETDARAILLAAVTDDRPKPKSVSFPKPAAKSFPGSAPAQEPPSTRDDASDHILVYAALSIGCLLLAVGLLFVMLWKAEILSALGFTGNLFYVTLIPTAISAAGFLLATLRSVAIHRGQAFGGRLVLGGPVLAAILVVWGGFTIPSPEGRTVSGSKSRSQPLAPGPATPTDSERKRPVVLIVFNDSQNELAAAIVGRVRSAGAAVTMIPRDDIGSSHLRDGMVEYCDPANLPFALTLQAIAKEEATRAASRSAEYATKYYGEPCELTISTYDRLAFWRFDISITLK